MPSDNRVGIYDGQARAPAVPDTGQQDPKHSVRGPEFWALDTSTKNSDLLTKSQVLQGQLEAAFEETLKERQDWSQYRHRHPRTMMRFVSK